MAERPRVTPAFESPRTAKQLVSYHTEARVADAGVLYPITPSTEGGELFQQSFAEGRLNAFGRSTLAIEAEGEHAAQGAAIAYSVCGRRVVNFTSGQGVVYRSRMRRNSTERSSTRSRTGGRRSCSAFTTCQPEHGVGDDQSLNQAHRVRDSRGMPEFVFNPRNGESYHDALDLKGNPSIERDWYETKFRSTGEPYRYTVAHWCATEARFRNHFRKIARDDAASLIPLDDMLARITMDDVVYRRHLDRAHRAYVPDFGVCLRLDGPKGIEYRSISRQLVLFCIERRKAWRLLQSKAGIVNRDYAAQRAARAGAGGITGT